MSQDVERVYTINLGKVLLSQSQHRAVRAINMIKEFARHHMKTESIKIEEELDKFPQKIWSRGVRRPPRKIRVRMSKTDEGHILVSLYDEEAESKILADSDTAKKTDATPAAKDSKDTDSESTTKPDTMESKPDEKPDTTPDTTESTQTQNLTLQNQHQTQNLTLQNQHQMKNQTLNQNLHQSHQNQYQIRQNQNQNPLTNNPKTLENILIPSDIVPDHSQCCTLG